MDGSLGGTLLFGLVLGLKHALDADHLVAVSTMVGRSRSLWRSAWVGVVWGIGHTASLFVAAVAVILLRVTIPPAVALGMELCVGLMLIVLGGDLIRRVVSGEITIHSHAHEHADHRHVHLHVHTDAAQHVHHGVGRRPFIVGLVHGMAGSAALMLFVLSTIANPLVGLLYVAIFGAGTIGGMLAMSALIGLPFAVASVRLSALLGRLQLAVGVGSVTFGVFYTWQVAVADRLFASF